LGLPLCREASAAMRDPLLEVNGLKKHFPIRRGLLGRVSGHVYAVDGLFLFGHFNREHDRNFTIRRRPDREKPRRRRCQDGHALLARPTPVRPATNYPGELDLAAAALRQCRSLSYLVQGVWVCSNTCLTSINRLPRAIRSANMLEIELLLSVRVLRRLPCSLPASIRSSRNVCSKRSRVPWYARRQARMDHGRYW